MKIALVDNKGIILSRSPEKIEKQLILSFKNAKEGAKVVLINDKKNELYRKIDSDKKVVFPSSFLNGVLKIIVLSEHKKWRCEEVVCEVIDDEIFVYPNDMDIPTKIAEIELENEDIKKEQAFLMEYIKKVESKLSRILEGYDLFGGENNEDN